MKKIVFITIISFISSFACEKEETPQCWSCYTRESSWTYEYDGETFMGKEKVWRITERKTYNSKDGWTQNRIEREVEMNTDGKKIKCEKTPCI